jgi:hypothetical protein
LPTFNKGNSMPNLIYRVVSACGALGYGYPSESLRHALKGRIDAIVCDAGSMDAGPYYLGTGTAYFERDAVKADYRRMVEAAYELGCPAILGSSGMAGGNRNLDRMVEIAKEVFSELGIRDVKVAIIRSEIDPEIVVREFRKGALRPTGVGPELSENTLRESVIVGQMGVHPLITALESGAQFILAGRSCDSALFASDMIRRGIDAGLAYHAAHILESGALACDPGSPSDCLVGEIYDDGTAVFVVPNPTRRCTAQSIAAHALYQESHPQLQFYPEGILTMEKTQFFSRDSRSAGIRDSRLVHAGKPWPWSIKLEGARRLGLRKVSLIHIGADDLPNIPDDLLVYGRNGVQAARVGGLQRELGIIVETAAGSVEHAVLLAILVARELAHQAYPGRRGNTGNIAYPLSPDVVSFKRADGLFGAIVPGGTRDPVFIENYAGIKKAVAARITDQLSNTLADADFTITAADASNPAILLRTVDCDPERLASLHQQEIDRITQFAMPKTASRFGLDAPDAYAWSLYHLLQNEDVIRKRPVPDHLLQRNRRELGRTGHGASSLFRYRRRRLSRRSRQPHALSDRRSFGFGSIHRLASAAGHGRGDSQQGCWRQSSDLRHHFYIGRELRSCAALQRLQQGQHCTGPESGAGARLRDVLRRQLQRNQDFHRSSEHLGIDG